MQLADERFLESRTVARKLKVFLSSTAQDLAPFRKAVHVRLATSPLFECLRQEDFGAHSHPPVTVCEAQVRECDLFIGLIGMRRGWEPPGDPGKRSITEMEYDWAKEIAPRFMHVTAMNFPVPGDLHETPEERGRHYAFRRRIAGEVVVSDQGFVSEENLLTPDTLARLVVDQLTKHVLESGLLDRVRAQPPRDGALSGLPDAVAERVLRALERRGDLKKAEAGGLEREVVFKLAKRLKPDEALDFDRAVKELENAITVALDAIARGQRNSNEDEFVANVLKQVAEHTQKGETAQAVEAIDEALAELDTREAEQFETLKRSRLTLLQAGIEQDILRRDATSVARRIERSAVTQSPNDLAASFATLCEQRDMYHVEGRDKGISFSLEIAIEVARRCVAAAHDEDQRVKASTRLGATLRTLGGHEPGTARIEEAIAVYHKVLTETTRERSPLDWAMIQNNLGIALRNLGARETRTARLNEAVAAFRQALTERTRERAPTQWAMTQNNLGNALLNLGERETGTARLQEAIAAFQNALKEWTRERAPRDWAMAQHNLGTALLTLGQRDRDTAQIKKAITACREALKERTREHVPLQWAMTHHNLGTALLNLDQLEPSIERLNEAIDAFSDALKERTRDRVPLDWAISHGNQGVALANLSERCGDAAMADAAVEQIKQALATMREAGHLHFAELYERRLPEAQAVRNRLRKI